MVHSISRPKQPSAMPQDFKSWDPWPGGCRNFLDSLDPIKARKSVEMMGWTVVEICGIGWWLGKKGGKTGQKMEGLGLNFIDG